MHDSCSKNTETFSFPDLQIFILQTTWKTYSEKNNYTVLMTTDP